MLPEPAILFVTEEVVDVKISLVEVLLLELLEEELLLEELVVPELLPPPEFLLYKIAKSLK